jgi:tetratricopeptide (TPR) repeat protein
VPKDERIAGYREVSGRIEALFDLGNDEEGEKLLSEAVRGSEQDEPYHLFFRSEAAGYLKKDHKRQKQLLAEAVRLRPDDYFLARSMGVCLLLLGKEKESIGWFERALAENPADHAALRYAGLALSNQGQERDAIQWYQRALTANPADYDAMRQIGISLAKLKEDEEAISWYRQALAVNGKDYDSMRQMGVSLASLGDYRNAIAWLTRALAVNGRDGDARRNLKIIMELHAEEMGELGYARKLWRQMNRWLDKFGGWLQSLVTSRKRGL